MRFVRCIVIFFIAALVEAALSAASVAGLVVATNAGAYGAASQAGTLVLILLVAPVMVLGVLLLLLPAFAVLAAMRRLSLSSALVAGAAQGVVAATLGITVIARDQLPAAGVAGVVVVATGVAAVGAWAGYAVWKRLEPRA